MRVIRRRQQFRDHASSDRICREWFVADAISANAPIDGVIREPCLKASNYHQHDDGWNNGFKCTFAKEIARRDKRWDGYR